MRKALAAFIFLFSFFLTAYNLNETVNFHPDFARDMFEILKISQGNLTMLGPKLSFGGIYTAPYYFYLFVPSYILAGFSIMGVMYFNALLFSLASIYFFIKASHSFGLTKAFIASLSWVLLPLTLIAGKNPGNANSYLSLLFIYLTYISFSKKINSDIKLALLGFAYGVIVNFNFICLLLFPSILLMFYVKVDEKKRLITFMAGFIFSFLPIFIFEMKNNFVIFQNTFIQKSYLSWLNNTNIPGGIEGNKNIILNTFFMSSQIQPLLLIPPLILLPIVGYMAFIEKKQRVEALQCFAAFLFLVVLIRFQFAQHYLYPTALFLFFMFIYIMLKSKYSFFLVLYIVVELILFPKYLYATSQNKPEMYDNAVKYVIDQNIIDKNSSFNVIQVADPNAVIAFEYRYFFQKYGFPPKTEFEYNSSEKLIIFSRKKIDVASLSSWEIQQFGKIIPGNVKKYSTNDIHIYSATK